MMRWVIYLVVALCVSSCHLTPKKGEVKSEQVEVKSVDSEAKFNRYITTYWYGFDFRDTINLRPETIERPFARYLTALPQATDSVRQIAITSLLDSAAVNPISLRHIISLSEKYLYEPSSPVRHEQLYIDILNAIIAQPSLDEYEKIRPKYQLTALLKNQQSQLATPFEITLRDGSSISLHSIEAEYILLLFNNPECAECQEVKKVIIKNKKLLNQKGVLVVAVYPDSDLKAWLSESYPNDWVNGYCRELSDGELYHLQAIPTIYLLDSQKRVVLKDASIEEIFSIMNYELLLMR